MLYFHLAVRVLSFASASCSLRLSLFRSGIDHFWRNCWSRSFSIYTSLILYRSSLCFLLTICGN
ncbi:hypothetical protein C2G38_521231 [Gigaspora rosea]|uniref:Uncharacterized protein n=1 Tax=Gigaspora rosea TaxID=44941 RepID=A0A397U835_9GLOM|nr:hypothetical protein C2G38_521231 [Gigaspora rosea]